MGEIVRFIPFFSLLSFLVITVIYSAVKYAAELSLTSVLNILKGIRITFHVNDRNVVKRLDAKDDEIRICEHLGITA